MHCGHTRYWVAHNKPSHCVFSLAENTPEPCKDGGYCVRIDFVSSTVPDLGCPYLHI